MKKSFVVCLVVTVFAGFGRVARADSDASDPDPKSVARVLKLKQRALRISSGQILIVQMVNKEEIRGSLVKVEDQGISLRIRDETRPRESSIRLIRFDEIQRMDRRPGYDPSAAFAPGVLLGFFGPFGWLMTWAMATGKD